MTNSGLRTQTSDCPSSLPVPVPEFCQDYHWDCTVLWMEQWTLPVFLKDCSVLCFVLHSTQQRLPDALYSTTIRTGDRPVLQTEQQRLFGVGASFNTIKTLSLCFVIPDCLVLCVCGALCCPKEAVCCFLIPWALGIIGHNPMLHG